MSLIESSDYYQDRVLGGLFSAANTDVERLARVREVTTKLQEEHFTGKRHYIFNMMKRYFALTYALISPKDYNDAIKADDEATEALVFEYQQLFISYRYGNAPITTERPDGSLTYITPAEFSYAIKRLREQTQTDLYGATLSDVMQVLVSGKTVDRQQIRGFEAAKSFYAQQLIEIEHLGGDELAEGTVSEEAAEMKEEYASAKNGTTEAFHVFTGIREIDNVTGGGAPGEMWLLTGFTAEGKTTECINVTYNAMLNGQNVVFGTAETLREQVRRRLICRHSVNPKFRSPRGISGDALKKGKLTEQEEQLFFAVVDDLANDPSYGKFKIVQIPKRCTVDYFSALLAKYESEFHTHVAVWDELRLAGVDYRRGSRREELNDIITDAKQMAVNHKHRDDSTGVLLLAPYQVSRAHWQQAMLTGHYDKSCLAETSEAEKTADLIWSHLQQRDTHDLFCQILKYRDGSDRTPDFTLAWRPEVCYISSQASVHDGLLDL
jgi:hypothetical protein